MQPFEYNSHASRVLFGSGEIRKLPNELARLNKSSPLILSTPQQIEQAEQVQGILGTGNSVGIFSQASMHTPVDVTERALKVLRDQSADSIVSIGGGSTIGLGKALAVRTGLPHICIPTTYAGSEMTPILGETENGLKTTRRDGRILPGTVIYDVDLTMTLPLGLTATSGVNAIAHSVEALYASNGNPIIELLALESIKALAVALPRLIESPGDKKARHSALYGAWLCGTCLGSVDMAIHHKLCHTLGGSLNLPHAETHTILLPHTLSYNAPAIPNAMKRLGTIFPESGGDAVHGLNVLLQKLGVERALSRFGMHKEDIAKAADIAVANPYNNPRKIERDAIQELIRRAWAGEDARADL